MNAKLPPPRPCSMCESEDDHHVKVLVVPRRGRLELSSREIEAAVFECKLCGAVRVEPLVIHDRAAA